MTTYPRPTVYIVAIAGVRPVAPISAKALARKHRQAFLGMAGAMTTPELERWTAWSKQFPLTAAQRADLDDAYAAASYDIAFDAAKAAGRLPAMAEA